MPGTLFVVATPIGNLEDITLRALRVLREVDLIAAEDTRRTAQLLNHFGIPTQTTSFHAHNARSRMSSLIARLEAGDNVAVVSDAGTPGVADPGVELIRAAISFGIRVDAIPGPSAPVTAALASGFSLERLTILGFVPSKARDRLVWLHTMAAIPGTVTFFETPHRIAETLAALGEILGDRPILVAREMTKVHQQFIRGTAATVVGQMTVIRGEFTIVVGPRTHPDVASDLPTDDEVFGEFTRMTESGVASRRDAVAAVAQKFRRPAREVYAAVERAKNSGR